MHRRTTHFFALVVGISAPPLWAQLPADFAPLVYEAEDYTGPKDAYEANRSSPCTSAFQSDSVSR